MWTTTITHKNATEVDKVVKITHDFGNGMKVVTDFEQQSTTVMHGDIAVGQHEIIADTDHYFRFLNSIDNEVNALKTTTE